MNDACPAGHVEIDMIIKASKFYSDDQHMGLGQHNAVDERLMIYYHKNCVYLYSCSSKTATFAKSAEAPEPTAKKLCSGSHSSFGFFTG